MNILTYLILIPLAFSTILPESPYHVPPDGTYLIETPFEITTQLLCDYIDVDPFVPHYVVQGNPGQVFLYVTEPSHVTTLLITCYDLRWNYTQYIVSVDLTFIGDNQDGRQQ